MSCSSVFIKVLLPLLTLWHPAAFEDFQKKRRSARSFAWEFLSSCKGYGPGQSIKRRGKSCSLHSIKIFLLGWCRFFVSDIINGGLLGHFAWPWAPTVRW